MTLNRHELAEKAADWTIGGPLVLFDQLRDAVGRVWGRTERRAEELAQRSRRHTREAIGDVRESASELIHDVRTRIAEPDVRPYEERTLEELYQLAQEREIDGRSQMNKPQLIAALRDAR